MRKSRGRLSKPWDPLGSLHGSPKVLAAISHTRWTQAETLKSHCKYSAASDVASGMPKEVPGLRESPGVGGGAMGVKSSIKNYHGDALYHFYGDFGHGDI